MKQTLDQGTLYGGSSICACISQKAGIFYVSKIFVLTSLFQLMYDRPFVSTPADADEVGATIECSNTMVQRNK
jgi:hypothetical protein